MGIVSWEASPPVSLDPQDVLTRSAAFFGEQVALLTDEDLDLTTAREGWDVKTLVAYLVLNDAVVKDALEGIPTSLVTEFDPKLLGTSPVTVWRGTALAMIQAFAVDGALEAVVEFGGNELTGAQLLGFRASDSLVFGWELGQAIGQPRDIPDDLAEYVLDSWLPFLQEIENPTFVGDGPLEPAEDATSGQRLLALMGRSA